MTTLTFDEVLITYTSDSRDDVEYEVRLRADDDSHRFLSCNCPSWTRASANSGRQAWERSCKHTNRAAMRFGQLATLLKGEGDVLYGGEGLGYKNFQLPPVKRSYIRETQAIVRDNDSAAQQRAERLAAEQAARANLNEFTQATKQPKSIAVERALAGDVKIVTIRSDTPGAREALLKYTAGGTASSPRWMKFVCRECEGDIKFFARADKQVTCPKCQTINYFPVLAWPKVLAQVAPLARDDAGQVYWLICRRCGALLGDFPQVGKVGQCRICAGEIDFEGAGRSVPERLYPTSLPGATQQGRGMIVLTFGEAQQLLEFEPARLPLEPEIILDDFFKGVRAGGGATGRDHEAYTDDEANRIKGIQPRGDDDD